MYVLISCAHVRTYMHTHLHTHTFTHTCTHTPSHTHLHTCTPSHTPAHMHTFTHTPAHIHLHTHLHTCTPVHTHLHTCTHTGSCLSRSQFLVSRSSTGPQWPYRKGWSVLSRRHALTLPTTSNWFLSVMVSKGERGPTGLYRIVMAT